MILRLKRTPGIYLVGFMACGKTTVGKLLAEELGWHFVDIDDDIVAAAGCEISEIFDQRGEAEFRQLEHQAITARVGKIERGNPTVIALGGGAFAQERNYELVSANGISVWIDSPLEMLRKRVAQDETRPLARDPEKFSNLFESRREAYSRADFRIEVCDEDPERILAEILKLPIF
jgi:shikimate kinase